MVSIESMCDSPSVALTINPDEATVQASPGAAKFRISLWPDASGVLPKLTRLQHNNQILCRASEYNPQSFFNRFFELPIKRLLSPRRLSPTPGISNFSEGSSDVQIKTVVLDGADGSISRILGDFVNEQSITAADWSPRSPAIVGITSSVPRQIWPTPPAATTSRTAPAPWVPVAPPPSFIPNGIRGNAPPRVDWPSFVCGQEGTRVPYIQRGKEFPRGRYPWLTAVYHKESFSLAFKCGGSLISTSLVITAAHCVYKIREDRVLVALGRYDLDNYSEDGAEVRDASRIVMHPEYSSRLQLQPDADIALITLDSPVIFNDIISPICLWDPAERDPAEPEIGSIAGWGTDENGNSMTRFPRVVSARIATVGECARRWKVQKILDRTLCAGNLDGSGPCLGDSGGGLMIKRNNRWLLRGIVSLGERSTIGNCNNNNQYVLYCDLAKHMTWINQQLS